MEYIEKKIKPIENERVRHIEYRNYLGCLPEEELVIYGVYKRISLVPSIYKYDSKIGLTYNESSMLGNLLGSKY